MNLPPVAVDRADRRSPTRDTSWPFSGEDRDDMGGGSLVGRLVRLPFAVPGAVVGASGDVWGWVVRAVGVGVDLPGVVAALLEEVVRLVAVIGGVVVSVEQVVGDARRIVAEVDDVLDAVRGTVVEVHGTVVGAEQVSRAAASTGRTVDELIALYEPLARDAAPLLARFVDELSSSEVDAAIKLVDQLPALTEAVQSDVMPILATLDRVAPDLRELLDVAKDVRKAIDGVPGSGFFRRRGEAVDEERDSQ